MMLACKLSQFSVCLFAFDIRFRYSAWICDRFATLKSTTSSITSIAKPEFDGVLNFRLSCPFLQVCCAWQHLHNNSINFSNITSKQIVMVMVLVPLCLVTVKYDLPKNQGCAQGILKLKLSARDWSAHTRGLQIFVLIKFDCNSSCNYYGLISC